MKNSIKKIYKEAFGNDECFFETLYETAANCCKVLIKNKKIVSFFFLLPIKLKKGTLIQKAYYLFAAATDKEHRNKGYMGELIKKELEKSDFPILLKPATPSLISYYKKFGFAEKTAYHKNDATFQILPMNEFSDFSPEKDGLFGEFAICVFGETDFDINGITFEYTME